MCSPEIKPATSSSSKFIFAHLMFGVPGCKHLHKYVQHVHILCQLCPTSIHEGIPTEKHV